MTNADFLRSIDMFSELDDELLKPIVDQSETVDLQRGDVVFQSGDESSDLYIVTHGRIAIGNRSFDGRESLVALMEAGDLFGEMPLFSNDGRSAEARALEESSLIVIPYKPIKDLYDDNPALLWRVVEMLVSRLKSTDIALSDTMFLDVTGRTAKRLLEMAGDSDEFRLPITQEELAGMIGASRERVNKSISSFIKLGWISQSGEKYIILDRKQLEIRST
ncbi:MAG: Crp/Fnr family transcriptional regulator [Acidimicrobiaceae bacterium]|jgi:CRP-like cAMP-binding protein|nr:Crp/Fnr family transcriptional regulator [Acidimicrobiaceae bacterium]|tara:strand:+ start:40484 stop:41143 length:660 start_codon:yes stop_codon:yes gene_type:complete